MTPAHDFPHFFRLQRGRFAERLVPVDSEDEAEYVSASYYYNDACVKPPFSAANLDRWRGYAGLRHPLLLPLGCQHLAQKRLFIAIGRIRRCSTMSKGSKTPTVPC